MEISKAKLGILPTRDITSLKTDFKYKVIKLKTIKNDVGEEIIVEYSDEGKNKFQSYLPEHYNDNMNEKDMNVYNLHARGRLFLVYKGIENGNVIVEFSED